jgi:putative colanic acid biosynthesis UDP-glucose lipid carrier transferase
MMTVSVDTEPHVLSYERTKRLIDLILAGVSFFLLLPLLALIAIAIRLDSKGPVLFRQLRGGRNGEPFRIYKFRTMHVLEDGTDVRQATRNDNRITRVGRWLRSSSLDELPQLLNVIAGDMALVGPRPHALAHDAQYGRLIPSYRLRFQVRPGITGLAQVSGCRGETPEVADMRRRVDLDNLYIAQQCLALDMKILLRTVAHAIN